MIIGLGTDIADIARVTKVYNSTGQGFVDRILTESEKEKLPTNSNLIPAYLAKRFAVKEAAAKALGTGIADGVSFHDFKTVHDAAGAPTLELSGRAKELAQQKNITHWHVSLSDEKAYALATVIAESN